MKSKITISVCVICALVLALSGCGSVKTTQGVARKSDAQQASGTQTPQEAVNEMTGFIKSGDVKSLAACYTSNKNVLNLDEKKASDESTYTAEFMKACGRNLSVQLSDIKTSDTTATATAQIKNSDFSNAIADLFAYAFSQEGSNSTGGDMLSVAIRVFNNEAKSGATKSFSIPISLVKDGSKWKIESSNGLIDALTGGYLSATEKVNN